MAEHTELLRRAHHIWKTEGLGLLAKRGLLYLASRSFVYEHYYLYEIDIEEQLGKSIEADFLPRIDDCTLKIVFTNQEAEELELEGLEFRSQLINSSKALDAGAIAFCIFVGRELASMAWLAMTEQAKNCLPEPKFRVDFSGNEVCLGTLWTNSKYRGMGLASYASYKRLQFSCERGKVAARAVTAEDNVATQRVDAKLGAIMNGRVHYLRILWWKSWKEKPLADFAKQL